MANLFDLLKKAAEKIGKGEIKPIATIDVDSEDALRSALQLFTAAQNRVETTQADCNKAMQDIANKYVDLVLDDSALLDDLEGKISAFVLANKSLFPGGKKTIDYKIAKVSYRDVPVSLVIDDESAAAQELLDKGMVWAVKTTHSIIKDAVKAKWEELCKEFKPTYMRLSPAAEAVIIKPAKIAKVKEKAK